MTTIQDTKNASGIGKIMTFAASLAVGCGAAVAFAGAAAVSYEAPTMRNVPATAEIVRLEPVVVTISRAQFEQVRRDATAQDNALARANEPKKVTRG